MNFKLIALALVASLSFVACGSQGLEESPELSLDLEDAVVQQIYNFKNRRQTATLLPYLSVENPVHRLAAVNALASLQDSAAINDLAHVLRNDASVQIREAAAFALGMTGLPQAANILADAFQPDSSSLVRAAILEAVGRCGTEEHLKYIAASPPYPLKDTALVEGLALGLLRFALRGMVHPEGTAKIMDDFLANSLLSARVRFIAANYLTILSPSQAESLTKYQGILLNNLQVDKDPNTRMFLVFALAKTRSDTALRYLQTLYEDSAEDYRLRCNILRSWQYFPYDSVAPQILATLQDSNQNLQVRRTAADFIYTYGLERDAWLYADLGRKHRDWQVSLQLYAAALNKAAAYQVPLKQTWSQELMQRYNQSEAAYEKALILKVLAEYPWNYRFIAKEVFPLSDSIKPSAVIRSSGMEGLCQIRRAPHFERDLGLNAPRVKEELMALFRQGIESADPGLIGVVADLFLDKKFNFKNELPETELFRQTQAKLSLPQAMESYWLLQRCIDHWTGKPQRFSAYEQAKDKYAEINWILIKTLGPRPQLAFNFESGKVVIELYPELAPATVSQIVQLAKAGFYNQKPLHRVAPNFVIQGGCERGDGWGGFSMGLVSELSMQHYWREGAVGMAHGGKDTEGSQFFISLSPTLQLDGNYTFFGQVIEGMKVVHQLNVGEKILSVELL